MNYYITKSGKIVNANNELVPMDESSPLYQDYLNFLKANGTVKDTEFDFETPIEIPEVITRRQFKIALAVLGKNEQSILIGIDQLPEPNRTIARISYMEAGTFERNNPELITVATAFLQMDSQQIDQVFIIGSQY
jgi:hypothetical protein